MLYQFLATKSVNRCRARAICERREQQPIRTTAQLASLIQSVMGRGEPGKHPATRSYRRPCEYI